MSGRSSLMVSSSSKKESLDFAALKRKCDSTVWVKNHQRENCVCCQKKFHRIGRRKHHCRICGEVVCSSCSFMSKIIELHLRVCVNCISIEQQQHTLTPQSDKQNLPTNPPSHVTQLQLTPSKEEEKPKEIPVISTKETETIDTIVFRFVSTFTVRDFGIILLAFVGSSISLRFPWYICASLNLLCLIGIALFLQHLAANKNPRPIIAEKQKIVNAPPIEKKEDAVEHENQPTQLEPLEEGSASKDVNSVKYGEKLLEAFEQAQEAFSSNDGDNGWAFFQRKKEVDIHLKTTESGLTFVQGAGILNASIEESLEVASHHSVEYDPNLKSADELTDIDPSLFQIEGYETIKFHALHTKCHRVYPTAARDGVMIRCSLKKINNASGKPSYLAVTCSIVHPDAPETKDYVRMNLICGAIYLEEGDDNTKTNIKVLTMVDPNGSIPSFVVSKVSPQRALIIDNMRKLLKK